MMIVLEVEGKNEERDDMVRFYLLQTLPFKAAGREQLFFLLREAFQCKRGVSSNLLGSLPIKEFAPFTNDH